MAQRISLTAFMLVTLLSAQDPQTGDTEVAHLRETFSFVAAPASVRDADGNVITNLKPSDFRLLDNGKVQNITEDVASHPISLVVAVQASANMEHLLLNIRKIGSLFTGLLLGEDGEMAVVAFDHRIQTLTDFTSDADKIGESFRKIKAGSSQSHLNDAAMDGVVKLRHRDRAHRKMLLLISESRDYGSVMNVRDVLTQAEFQDIVVYTVSVSHLLTSLTSHPDPPRPNGIPPEARTLPAGTIGTLTTQSQGVICCTPAMGDMSPMFREIFNSVKSLFVANPHKVYTKFTGGREYTYMTQSGLEHAIADMVEEVRTQYLLTYLPSTRDQGGYHQIELRVLRPGLKVTTRPGYWAAAKPQ